MARQSQLAAGRDAADDDVDDAPYVDDDNVGDDVVDDDRAVENERAGEVAKRQAIGDLMSSPAAPAAAAAPLRRTRGLAATTWKFKSPSLRRAARAASALLNARAQQRPTSSSTSSRRTLSCVDSPRRR